MRLPPLITAILRERPVCIGFLITGIVLITGRLIGLTVYVCPFQAATGLPCPGCGLTRGTTALLRGDVQSALGFHPFSPLVVVCVLLLVLSLVLPEAPRERLLSALEKLERRTAIAYIALAALMAFGLWRMVQQMSF